MGKLIPFKELEKVRGQVPGKTIAQCHGVFDLFHFGHLLHLKSAREKADVLVVTVTPDRFVNKGPGRPHHSEHQRAAMLTALQFVDFVAINVEPRADSAIKALKPDFYVKGPDYKNKEQDITGGISEEEACVASVGGKLVFTDDPTDSSTTLINSFLSAWDDEQRRAIDAAKAAGTLRLMGDLLQKLPQLKVLVVGEPIVDTYVFCSAEGISSKSPTVSARVLRQEDYAGGSLAIANHLSALGCQTSIMFTHGDEPYFHELLKKSMDPKVKIHGTALKGVPTPRKTRFMTPFRSQRIFELVDLRADQWELHSPDPFLAGLGKIANEFDVVILADFGHGLFEGKALEFLPKIKSFVGLNVQTNSTNFGFNRFTKHSRFDYLSIDEKECRLGLHDRFTPPAELIQLLAESVQNRPFSITLGTSGSLFQRGKGDSFKCPTFVREVVDTTGAGDAYFAITTLLAQQKFPTEVIPFVGNCYAGLKTRIMGNAHAVSKVDLVRTLESLLK